MGAATATLDSTDFVEQFGTDNSLKSALCEHHDAAEVIIGCGVPYFAGGDVDIVDSTIGVPSLVPTLFRRRRSWCLSPRQAIDGNSNA